jgi:hypothetical protein
MPVALRSRKSCETMVGASMSAQLPCTTNASCDEKASHHEKQAAGCADAIAKAADEALAGSLF